MFSIRLDLQLRDALQKGRLFSADQHIPIYGDQNVGDVRAHFDCLAQIGHKHDLEVLREQANRGAEEVTLELITVIDRIEREDQAIGAIELRVDTHIFVKLLLEHTLLILLDYLHSADVQYEADYASAWDANKNQNVLNGEEHKLHVLIVNCSFITSFVLCYSAQLCLLFEIGHVQVARRENALLKKVNELFVD